MREAGKLASEVLEMIGDFVKPGISTGELDKICHDYIVDVQNAIPANVGYRGFEKTLCTSINQVICHGIPDENRILKSGDIMNIYVHYVSTFQDSVLIRNSMTNNLIDTGAESFFETSISYISRYSILNIDNIVVAYFI